MNAPATIGICIPTRNQADTLEDTLVSAFAQTRPAADVLISDDAGTDDTPARVERFRTGLPTAQRRVLRYVRHATPLGIGGNFDHAVRHVGGDYRVKVDSDDILEPQFVERLATMLDQQPQAGWAHVNVWNIAPDRAPLGLAHHRKRTGFTPADAVFRAYLHHNDTCHCVMIRASAYVAAGGYRPAMRTCEDWLLWLEMALAGFGNVYDETPLARMRKYESRPDLMARRRLDFVESAALMLDAVTTALTPSRALACGVAPDRALAQLRASVAAQVQFAILHEPDPAVRARLLDAVRRFSPTARNRLWCAAANHLPQPVMRLPGATTGLARRVARQLLRRHAGSRTP